MLQGAFLYIAFFSLAAGFCGAFEVCVSPTQVVHKRKCFPPCQPGFEGGDETCEVDDSGIDDSGSVTSSTNYIRGVGVDFVSCSSESFTRSVAPRGNDEDTFSMIIVNDPQLVWWRDPSDGEQCLGDEECKRRNAEQEALDQVRAMNAITDLQVWPGGNEAVSRPKGVIVNGDLTQYFHPHEFELFQRYYTLDSNNPHGDVLRFPLYVGLGNHDYANNVNDCWWWLEVQYLLRTTNGCAQKAVDYVKGMISCGTSDSFPRSEVESYDSGSLAYSWNYDNYHFIQLHNYVTYTNIESIGISSSMEWLEQDLSRAVDNGQKIIVNVHDLDTRMDDSERDAFLGLLESANVVAIFCGHIISDNNLGYQGNFGSIPVFRGGHGGEKNRNRFLLVKFASDYLRVLVVKSFGGIPRFEGVGDETYDKTIAL
ncbi:Calcineurin-like phosphoesterase [Gracilaria domingensis]|nr:Calcineurin-like phosphoesterase [Gracilaria domingensis]